MADAWLIITDAFDSTERKLKLVDNGDGTYSIATNVASSALPSGAATSANQVLQLAKYITKVEVASATITYVGSAAPGTTVAQALWRIMRVDTSSLAADVLYADSNQNFDNVWNDRAGLSYG